MFNVLDIENVTQTTLQRGKAQEPHDRTVSYTVRLYSNNYSVTTAKKTVGNFLETRLNSKYVKRLQ